MSGDYVLDKNPSEFGGMGSEIYGKTINGVFDDCEASGRAVRYVHQENHYAGTGSDTRRNALPFLFSGDTMRRHRHIFFLCKNFFVKFWFMDFN